MSCQEMLGKQVRSIPTLFFWISKWIRPLLKNNGARVLLCSRLVVNNANIKIPLYLQKNLQYSLLSLHASLNIPWQVQKHEQRRRTFKSLWRTIKVCPHTINSFQRAKKRSNSYIDKDIGHLRKKHQKFSSFRSNNRYYVLIKFDSFQPASMTIKVDAKGMRLKIWWNFRRIGWKKFKRVIIRMHELLLLVS